VPKKTIKIPRGGAWAARQLAVTAAPFAVSERATSQGTISANQPRRHVMAITLGTFTKLENGAFTGTLKTLNAIPALTIVPVDKTSDNGKRHLPKS
jgi:hypothetical protein